jgi:hypothetical protein
MGAKHLFTSKVLLILKMKFMIDKKVIEAKQAKPIHEEGT